MIIKATYGGVDVTEWVKSLVKNQTLMVRASNDVFGDLNPGMVKYLEIESSYGSFKARENSYIQIPKSTNDRLGIFYSNNNVPKVVKESLMTLTKFSHKADILSCTWEHIDGNPFYEANAMSKTASHLNIIIQILQLLYIARESGQYKYVSFLEHDVLYPDGYFDFPDFEQAVMTNMNYKGICDEGWQDCTHPPEPLHQMSMVFLDAIKHFEKLLFKAIDQGNVFVEPEVECLHWYCKHPAVHVNHGKHFTSHFSIYSRQTHQQDAYWGDAQPWINKLFR